MDVALRSSFTIAAMLKSVRWTCPVKKEVILSQSNTKHASFYHCAHSVTSTVEILR